MIFCVKLYVITVFYVKSYFKLLYIECYSIYVKCYFISQQTVSSSCTFLFQVLLEALVSQAFKDQVVSLVQLVSLEHQEHKDQRVP